MKKALQGLCSESYHPNRCTFSQLGSSMEVQSEHEGLGIVHEDAIECVNQRIKGGEHRGQHDQMYQRHGCAQTRPCFVEEDRDPSPALHRLLQLLRDLAGG